MAKLPNGERARILMEKLTEYCLNPDHPRGKDQARVFAAVLGITRDSANELAALVRQAAREGDITKEGMNCLWAVLPRGLGYPDAGKRGVAYYRGNGTRRRGSTPDFCLHALMKGCAYGTPQTF